MINKEQLQEINNLLKKLTDVNNLIDPLAEDKQKPKSRTFYVECNVNYGSGIGDPGERRIGTVIITDKDLDEYFFDYREKLKARLKELGYEVEE
jgi:hypothetical protein